MQEYCRTRLNYAGKSQYESVDVSILNGRLNEFSFDQAGFTMLDQKSGVSNWLDFEELTSVHMPEIAALSMGFAGCDVAVAYKPIIRSPSYAGSSIDYAPIESVHSDYTEGYRRMVINKDYAYQVFLQPLLDQAGLTCNDLANASRLMVMQFWRNIGDQNPDRPLALCGASTVHRDEMIPILVSEYAGALNFKAFVVRTPADASRHHWYTLPSLSKEETLAFRSYDSLCADEARAFYTPHTAFIDSTVGPDAPQRESVEIRALCVFR